MKLIDQSVDHSFKDLEDYCPNWSSQHRIFLHSGGLVQQDLALN